nr:hypothetical protein [Porphyromonas pogonae]
MTKRESRKQRSNLPAMQRSQKRNDLCRICHVSRCGDYFMYQPPGVC